MLAFPCRFGRNTVLKNMAETKDSGLEYVEGGGKVKRIKHPMKRPTNRIHTQYSVLTTPCVQPGTYVLLARHMCPTLTIAIQRQCNCLYSIEKHEMLYYDFQWHVSLA